MWLSSSSVGRKFVMAVTGACLVLFVTFHCLMNAVAILWPAAYNNVCEFLGANWYALVASVGLAALIVVHIIYAVWLTVQNRKARGADRYAISRRPKAVEWSSQNMLVLGIVILAFLVVHLIQFWAKMQLQEIRGSVEAFPPAAGTIFIQEAFSCVWTPIVYIIGFVALWFHMTHGFWSMFQSVGWDNTAWIPRWRKIGCWWTTIVVALFIAQAIVFTVKSHENFYKEDPALREQYKEMVVPMFEKAFGPNASQMIEMMPYEQFSQEVRRSFEMMQNPQFRQMNANDPAFEQQAAALEAVNGLLDYLEGEAAAAQNPMEQMMQQGPTPEQIEQMQQAAAAQNAVSDSTTNN